MAHYDALQCIDFSTASQEPTIGHLTGLATGIASAVKQLSRSREVAANCIGLSSTSLEKKSPLWSGTPTVPFRVRVVCFAFALLALFLSGCRQAEARPRDQTLPAFIPSQLRSFDCPTSSRAAKPVDIQAKAWFDESIALLIPHDGAHINSERVELLKQQAMARHYWPAIREKLESLDGEPKLVLIEAAMSEGEPEAFYMMGELYLKGDGVEANQAKADAFWQRAAMMGDVRAMVKLAVILSTKQNNTIGWDMVNIPVATSMLKCAMKMGYGDAAVPLRDVVSRPRKPDGSFAEDPDDAAEARGLAVLQEGVKLGSRVAAGELALYFLVRHQFDAQSTQRPHSFRSTAALRARYYQYLEHSLDEVTPERLPNLDAAVPLPPTPLPDWRDKEDNIVGLWEAATESLGKATAATGRSAKQTDEPPGTHAPYQ